MAELTKNDQIRHKLAELAKEGAKVENSGKMCSGCAFKLNTEANFDVETVEAAFECTVFGGTFYCHAAESTQCKGFIYAKKAISAPIFNPQT